MRPLFSRALAAMERTGDIYLANHSLGRPLDRTADDVRGALDLWYETMEHAWGPWVQTRERYRALMAELIGCGDANRVVPKTSAAQAFRAVLNAAQKPDGEPLRVLTTRGEFDSADFVLKAYHRKGLVEVERVEPDASGAFSAQELTDRLSERHDLLLVSQAFFVTGQVLHPLQPMFEKARALGVVSIVDTYHSAGVIPVGFDDLGADFAMGGNYKYTRGGPGACWLAIAARHARDAGPPAESGLFCIDTGWFAKADTFGYQRSDEPRYAAGGDAWLEATPPVLTWYQALAGLELTLGLGIDRLRTYSLHQQRLLFAEFERLGIETARVGDAHGAFVLVPTDRLGDDIGALARHGVRIDGRPRPDAPDRGYLRFCPDILTTEAELREAALRTRAAINERA